MRGGDCGPPKREIARREAALKNEARALSKVIVNEAYEVGEVCDGLRADLVDKGDEGALLDGGADRRDMGVEAPEASTKLLPNLRDMGGEVNASDW